MAPMITGPQIFDDANRPPARSSMFRAMMSPKGHKRNQSADDAMAPQLPQINSSNPIPFPWMEQPAQGPGHLPLAEIVPNRDTGDSNSSATKNRSKEEKGALHKKTKSAVSLKSLRSYMERRDAKPEEVEESDEYKPKKTKSSNSLSAILKRSQRGRKGDSSKQNRDKENRSPTDLVDNMPSPVFPQETASMYPEFINRSRQNSTADRRRSVAEEVSLYTPKGYSPAQQRNFYDFHQPSLTRTGEGKSRPKSDCLAGNKKMKNYLGNLQRAPSAESSAVDSASSKGSAIDRSRKMSIPGSPTKDQPNAKRLSRVQAAISALNAKEKDADVHRHLNSKDLESEFEKLLVGLRSEVVPLFPKTNIYPGRKEHPPQHAG